MLRNFKQREKVVKYFVYETENNTYRVNLFK